MHPALRAIDRFLIRTRTKDRVVGLTFFITGLVLLGLCPIVSADQRLLDPMNYVSMVGFNLLIIGTFILSLSSDRELLAAFLGLIRRLRNTAILLALFLAGTGVGLLVWDLIKVPFRNPLEVVGPLTVIKFSPDTNYLRFAVLVSLPSLLLASLFVVIKPRWREWLFPPSPFEEKLTGAFIAKWPERLLLGVGFFTLALFVINPLGSFFITGWGPSHIDFLHEGEFLTPAYNYKVTRGLWTASWFCHGVFFDPLSTYLGWEFFGADTIGASRLMIAFLWALNTATLGGLITTLALTFFSPTEWMGRLLFSQSMVLIFLTTNNVYQWCDRRDLFLLLGTCCLVIGIRRSSLVFFFLAGTGSALTYFYSIDRGAYYTAMLFALMAAWLAWPSEPFQRRLAPPFALLTGIIFGWIVFFCVFGATEFHQFLVNTAMFYDTKDLFDSFVFSLHDTSALVSIIAISVQCLVLTWCLGSALARRDFSSRTPWMIQAVIALLALFYFRSGLGRSDQPHIAYASTFALLGLSFPLVWWLREIHLPKLNLVILIYLMLFNLVLLISPDLSDHQNIWTVPERFRAFVQEPDSAYLTADEAAGIAELQTIFRNEKGVFALNSEPLLPYLIKKPSLGKNYFAWMCGSRPKREELLSTLRNEKPRYLIFDHDGTQGNFDEVTNQARFADVRTYVLTHYHQFKYVQRWQVYEINQISPSVPVPF
jgi:hypothetical protein